MTRHEDIIFRHTQNLSWYHTPTYQHSFRVGAHAANIAKHEGLDAQLLKEFGWLHDIGKGAVPKEWLNLDEITPFQFQVIKAHVRVGYEMLKYELPLHACIAGKHHPAYPVEEYPSGLSTDERTLVDQAIPIITLCDFYDALMTRHTSSFKHVDRRNPTAVHAVLEHHFPGQEKRIKRIIATRS